jgi:hypothetical protein
LTEPKRHCPPRVDQSDGIGKLLVRRRVTLLLLLLLLMLLLLLLLLIRQLLLVMGCWIEPPFNERHPSLLHRRGRLRWVRCADEKIAGPGIPPVVEMAAFDAAMAPPLVAKEPALCPWGFGGIRHAGFPPIVEMAASLAILAPPPVPEHAALIRRQLRLRLEAPPRSIFPLCSGSPVADGLVVMAGRFVVVGVGVSRGERGQRGSVVMLVGGGGHLVSGASGRCKVGAWARVERTGGGGRVLLVRMIVTEEEVRKRT